MKLSKGYLFVFLYGLGATISIRVVGILAISDIISILLIPFLISRRNMFVDSRFRKLLFFLFLWFVATFISDIVNESNLINSLKGFFTLVPFFSSLLFAYWVLRQNIRLIIPFLLGYSISFLLSAGFGIDAYYQESLARNNLTNASQLGHYSKIILWVIASFINGYFVLVYYKKKPKMVALILFILSLFLLIKGVRSSFLICFLVSVILLLIEKQTFNIPYTGKSWTKKLNKKKGVFILFIIASIFISKSLYEYGAENGILGEEEEIKYRLQSNSKLGLLSGRPGVVIAYYAILDSPLFGHGSYARDEKGFSYEAGTMVTDLGQSMDILYDNIGEEQIEAHSHILQAWVNNGILATFFWFYVLFGIAGKFYRNYLFSKPEFFAYALISLLSLYWSILFNPFQQKPFLAFNIIFFVVLMQKKQIF